MTEGGDDVIKETVYVHAYIHVFVHAYTHVYTRVRVLMHEHEAQVCMMM